jgi:peptidoglycan/xylan/chitin deacetylase (PgdA/CDA1 family)
MQVIYAKAKESKEDIKQIDVDLSDKYIVNLPILMYHHVDEIEKLPKNEQTKDRKSLTVSPATFAAQLDKLKSAGYETVTLEDLETAVNTKNQVFFTGKKIMLTFDDGYKEHYSVVFKELQSRGMKGVFGIITSNVSDKEESDKLTWSKLKEMQSAGMEIVSHTVSHCALGSYKFFDGRSLSPKGEYRKCNLANPKELNYGHVGNEMISEEQARFEVVESKKIIDQKLGINSRYLIFPYGAYNDEIFDLLWSSGYKLGLGVAGGPKIDLNNPFLLNRVTVIGGTKPDEMVGWFKGI